MKILVRFFKYLLPYWRYLLAVFASTGLFVVFAAAAYWLAAAFLQTLFYGEPASIATSLSDASINEKLKFYTAALLIGDSPQITLFHTAIAIILAFMAKNLFNYLQLFYDSYLEQRVIKDLRDEIFTHLLRQDLAFFQEHQRGSLISTILNDVELLNMALNKSFTKIIRDPLNAIFLFILLLIVSVKLTLISLIVVPTLGWIVLYLGKKIKKHSYFTQESLARLTSHLQETVGGIRIIKAFAAELFEIQRFIKITWETFLSSLSRERLRRMILPLNEFVGVLIVSCILYAGGELVLVRGGMESEDFIRFLVLLFAMLSPLISLGDLAANVRLAEAAGRRVFNLLDSEGHLENNPTQRMPKNFQSLCLNNVSFRYYSQQPMVLENLSLEISPGERIAIVGRSGCGKSSLVNLLPRFYDPVAGSVTFNGVDLRQLDLHQLRKRFGFVTQQVILFHDTIASNIAYGLTDIDEKVLEEAARMAFAHDFIQQLPNRYQTIVGEQGALFSGGQRQRISIARALLCNPQIVILDEATSSLDPEAEQDVFAALDRLTEGRTVITVTHRLAAIYRADRIVMLEEGKIRGIGAHEKLLTDCEPYYLLARQQRLLTV